MALAAAIGAPTTNTVSSNGTRIAVYSYAAVQSRPQNFIPYIGPLVAGYDTKSSAVAFVFDSRGVLINTTSSQSNLGTGANLAAGSAQPAPNVAQPRADPPKLAWMRTDGQRMTGNAKLEELFRADKAACLAIVQQNQSLGMFKGCMAAKRYILISAEEGEERLAAAAAAHAANQKQAK
jgi:hypothetical protein